MTNFRQLGVSHILVVSGMHITVLAGFLQLLLKRLPVRKAVGNALTALVILLFLALSGFQPSASRGAAMFLVLLLADSAGRRSDGLNSLGLAVLAVCLFNPFAGGDLGFALSVTATSGDCAFVPAPCPGVFGQAGKGPCLQAVEAGGCVPGCHSRRSAGYLSRAAGGVWGISSAAACGQFSDDCPWDGGAVPGLLRVLFDAAAGHGSPGGALCVGGRLGKPLAAVDGPDFVPVEGDLPVPVQRAAAGGDGRAASAVDRGGPRGKGPDPSCRDCRGHGGAGPLRRGVPGVAGPGSGGVCPAGLGNGFLRGAGAKSPGGRVVPWAATGPARSTKFCSGTT